VLAGGGAAGTGVAGVNLNRGERWSRHVFLGAVQGPPANERHRRARRVPNDRCASETAGNPVDKTVVVAIEDRTCLTLVFQSRPLAGSVTVRRGPAPRAAGPPRGARSDRTGMPAVTKRCSSGAPGIRRLVEASSSRSS